MAKLKDLTGQRFGRLVVIDRYSENSKRGRPQWICRCDCGNEVVLAGEYITNGNTKSCGCLKKESPKARSIDLSGQRFGRLQVIQKLENSRWLCKCDCGNETTTTTNSLRRGETRSCGCLHKEVVSTTMKKHGKTNTRLHRIWRHIKYRCFNESSKAYKNYGGRGITVCDEWVNDFQAFYDWAMKNGYSDNLTIDRIDNDGDYSPENCRWATYKMQANNKRNNHLIKQNGETHTLTEWSEIIGINRGTLSSRVNKNKEQ